MKKFIPVIIGILVLACCTKKAPDYREISDLSSNTKWVLDFTNAGRNDPFAVKILVKGKIDGKIHLLTEGKQTYELTGPVDQDIDLGDWYDDIYDLTILNEDHAKGNVKIAVLFMTM